MSKAFTRESDGDDDEQDRAIEEAVAEAIPAVKNYITPVGLQRLRDELKFESVGALVDQMARDVDRTRALMA